HFCCLPTDRKTRAREELLPDIVDRFLGGGDGGVRRQDIRVVRIERDRFIEVLGSGGLRPLGISVPKGLFAFRVCQNATGKYEREQRDTKRQKKLFCFHSPSKSGFQISVKLSLGFFR